MKWRIEYVWEHCRPSFRGWAFKFRLLERWHSKQDSEFSCSPVQFFFCNSVGIKSIWYHTRAQRLNNENNMTDWIAEKIGQEQIFFCNPVVLELIRYHMTANWLINENNMTGSLKKYGWVEEKRELSSWLIYTTANPGKNWPGRFACLKEVKQARKVWRESRTSLKVDFTVPVQIFLSSSVVLPSFISRFALVR